MTLQQIRTDDDHVLDVHLSEGPGDGNPTLLWHHGSPHTGALLEPVVAAAAARRLPVVTYARPSYAGSTPRPGRTVGSAGDDVRWILDTLGIERVVTIGYSGGGPHALAAAAALADRVVAVATLDGVAPYTTAFDWFEGMAAPGALRSAVDGGRSGRATFAETEEFDPSQFVEADWAALGGRWAAVGQDAQAAEGGGPDGLIDDDVAFTLPWGFELGDVIAPVLVVQSGGRVIPPSHGRWLAEHLPTADLQRRPDDGHVSVLDALPDAIDWLQARAAQT